MAFSASDPIKVSGGYEHSVIDCYVHDTEGGADIDAGDRATLENGNCYIENSEFEACDRLTKTYNMAINIGGCGNRATNNKLHDSAHMIFGWGGNNNIIAFNEVYDACSASDDMGALYAGRQIASRGNKILYNYIHDIGKSGALGSNGVHAIYLDEALTGTKDTRENFQRLLADCRDGKIDLVITKSISRFARNTVTLLETIKNMYGNVALTV